MNITKESMKAEVDLVTFQIMKSSLELCHDSQRRKELITELGGELVFREELGCYQSIFSFYDIKYRYLDYLDGRYSLTPLSD